MTTRGRLAVASALLALPMALAGCGGSDPDSAEPAPAPTSADSSSAAPSPSATAVDPDALQYVALGDSYAAAPGVPESDAANGCFRSDHNYAHVVAAGDASIALTDVTCSGATSDDVITKQVPSITRDTDLVSVGIGGNDFGLFTRVLGGCLASSTDAAAEGTPCTDTAGPEVAKVQTQIQDNLGKVLDAIVAAAPDATVVVVGYPALLPEDGTTCPDLVPLAAGDYPFVAGINRGLSDALEGEADERGLTYLDVFTASKGHDVCSKEPWVNGVQMAADGTIPLHPFAVEQAAIAAMILAVVG